MKQLEKIPSFQKNHDKLMQGLHECGVSHGVTTWDLRAKKPNDGDYITPKAIHSVEHIIATLLRNSAYGDDIIYFGPMGCRTGYYLLTANMDYAQVKELLIDCFAQATQMTYIPGSKKEECGNYLEHDLFGAKEECARYLEILESLS